MRGSEELQCEVCAAGSTFVAIELAATLLGVSQETIAQWVKGGSIHTRSAPGEKPLVCVKSVMQRAIRWPPVRDQRVKRILKECGEKYAHVDLELNALAGEVRLSKWRMARLFKKEIGIGLKTHLRLVRLLKATDLLGGTFLSMDEIAAEVGYKQLTRFDLHFQAAFQMTPGEYRARAWREWLLPPHREP